MEELLDECDSKEAVSMLERLDGVVRSFIQSERKSRCRLKVNYLINGAASNRLEEAIFMLSNANEIDDNLLRFIDSLIQKRITFVGGPTADKEDKKLLSASGKDAVSALKMVYKRLKAEMQFKKDFNLKLLAELIDEKDSDNASFSDGDKDNLYSAAVDIIKTEGKASTSFLQRKLQIGYNRAARIVDTMEAEGIVSKANHVGKRDVLK